MPASPASEPASTHASGPIPVRAGIGLKPIHYDSILGTRPDVGWFEAHPENYMGCGGPVHAYLTAIRERYPLSLHAVGLSLGSAHPPDMGHMRRLRGLVNRYQPGLVSDHLAWCQDNDVYLADLLPLPYTLEALDVVANNIERAQDFLGRQILIENPSLYVRPRSSTMPEAEFLVEVVRRTGCGILLDVNNLYVSAHNIGIDPESYLAAIPHGLVGEIHLAGHAIEDLSTGTVRVDDHGSPVIDAVWDLYRRAIDRFGPLPTLIEWDTDVPPLGVLVAEAATAQAVLASPAQKRHEHAA